MISLKTCCRILCVHHVLLFSIWYLSDWSYYLVNVQGWCHSILVIPFDFLTGMVPFPLVIYFWSYHLIFLQGWCHYHFGQFFGQLFLVIPFDLHTGMVPISFWMIILDPNTVMTWFELIFLFAFYIFGLPIFPGMVPFSF